MAMRPFLLILTSCLLLISSPKAEDLRFLSIGTGGVAGTYYPIGGLIAGIISNPPGARACEDGGSCGVPGLIAIAQSSNGSVANVEAVASGELDTGFAQSDVTYWAHTGTGMYAGEPGIENIRAIAGLYPESIHLVVRRGSGIEAIGDLVGKRVSLDEEGSGTLVDARIILEAFGIREEDIDASFMKPNLAIAEMREDRLDAFILIAGYPAGSVTELARSGTVDLIPITGPEVEKLLEEHDFFAETVIPADIYQDVGETKTLSVGAQWITSAEMDEDLVYGMTKALWHENARTLLDDGHAQARAITLPTALDGIAIPLHPGAERYYQEVDALKDGS
ncbi:MAG: TAXI family TRAP transporter solute-binding subunit [Geminicoccaceae bacterium]